jgi:hypothetical protein
MPRLRWKRKQKSSLPSTRPRFLPKQVLLALDKPHRSTYSTRASMTATTIRSSFMLVMKMNPNPNSMRQRNATKHRVLRLRHSRVPCPSRSQDLCATSQLLLSAQTPLHPRHLEQPHQGARRMSVNYRKSTRCIVELQRCKSNQGRLRRSRSRQRILLLLSPHLQQTRRTPSLVL